MTAIDAAGMAALTGGVVERAVFRHAELLLGEHGVLVVVDSGDGPDRSGVWSDREVRLLGEVPVTPRLRGILDTDPWRLPRVEPPLLHVAVRLDDGHLYLGTATMARWTTPGGPRGGGTPSESLADPCLRLDEPLERALLERVRPVGVADPSGPFWLDRVGTDPVRALEEFAADRYPAEAGPGPEVPSDLPEPLRRFHRLAATRPELLGGQNFLRPAGGPAQEDEEDAGYVIGRENQGVFHWTLRREEDGFGEDPTVWFQRDGEEPVPEEEPLSGFLLQFALYEAAVRAEYVALTFSTPVEQTEAVTRVLRPVPLRPFLASWMPTRLYAAPGLVVSVSVSDDRYDVWAGASHRGALAPLRDLPVDWERFDG
ncbi:hypothetical protein [Nocardiopsis lambiniae]|uniref:Uncharacterized protein n=1 Tax=Nocardiopsis lambiniae TaxID=3075539 RepID=A0ABU2ME62_9ACTN|nr:hypothetical protein [Nocardiopsis sp. DSM 44743]MDT0330868.1 hypothetical protein [Nocardiopsis sp. DSM 44743]